MLVLLFKDLGTSRLFILPKDPLSKWWRQDLNPHSLAPVTALKSGPQTFWHQGLVFWKTIFPQMGWGEDGSDSN